MADLNKRTMDAVQHKQAPFGEETYADPIRDPYKRWGGKTIEDLITPQATVGRFPSGLNEQPASGPDYVEGEAIDMAQASTNISPMPQTDYGPVFPGGPGGKGR